jgi:hypothetical protein
LIAQDASTTTSQLAEPEIGLEGLVAPEAPKENNSKNAAAETNSPAAMMPWQKI